MGSVDLVTQEQHGRMSSRGTSEDWVPGGQQRRQKRQLKIGQFGSISPVRQHVQNCMKLTGKVMVPIHNMLCDLLLTVVQVSSTFINIKPIKAVLL